MYIGISVTPNAFRPPSLHSSGVFKYLQIHKTFYRRLRVETYYVLQ